MLLAHPIPVWRTLWRPFVALSSIQPKYIIPKRLAAGPSHPCVADFCVVPCGAAVLYKPITSSLNAVGENFEFRRDRGFWFCWEWRDAGVVGGRPVDCRNMLLEGCAQMLRGCFCGCCQFQECDFEWRMPVQDELWQTFSALTSISFSFFSGPCAVTESGASNVGFRPELGVLLSRSLFENGGCLNFAF